MVNHDHKFTQIAEDGLNSSGKTLLSLENTFSDICRLGGMAKCSKLVNFLYIYFLKKIFSCLLLSRPLCWPPTWRHYWKDCMPVHNLSHPWAFSSSFLVPRLVTLCLRLQIQWLRSGLHQDQELKFLHPWRSKEKQRKYVNLSIWADCFSSTIWEFIYQKRDIERSRWDWG